MNAHMRAVVAAAAEHGLVVRQARRRGHFHLLDPDTGRLVATASSTPRVGDRALQQLRRDLRRRITEAAREGAS